MGVYAGILSASFCAAQFVSSTFWGWVSDKFGRRMTLLIGVSGTAVAVGVFGFATSYTHALVARIMAGVLNGNIGVRGVWKARVCSVHSFRFRRVTGLESAAH